MSKADDNFRKALEETEIPLLVLDNKWHQLFRQFDKEPEMDQLELRLNELLRKRAKLSTDESDIKRLKKKLMSEIVPLANEMNQHPNKRTEKQLNDNKRLINDCNEKIQRKQLELGAIPAEIRKINEELMLLTMEICYGQMQAETEEIERLDTRISALRIELKKSLVRKEEAEHRNEALYSYMHNIFGRDVINIFDMKYDPGESIRRKKEELLEKKRAERK